MDVLRKSSASSGVPSGLRSISSNWVLAPSGSIAIVLQADGGTRTASITGGYVALALAIEKLRQDGILKESPLVNGVAAVSMGVVDGVPLLDLDYKEDVNAEVDMNLVMTDENQFIEVQGTGEKGTFDQSALQQLLAYGMSGIQELVTIQRTAIAWQVPDHPQSSLGNFMPSKASRDSEAEVWQVSFQVPAALEEAATEILVMALGQSASSYCPLESDQAEISAFITQRSAWNLSKSREIQACLQNGFPDLLEKSSLTFRCRKIKRVTGGNPEIPLQTS